MVGASVVGMPVMESVTAVSDAPLIVESSPVDEPAVSLPTVLPPPPLPDPDVPLTCAELEGTDGFYLARLRAPT